MRAWCKDGVASGNCSLQALGLQMVNGGIKAPTRPGFEAHTNACRITIAKLVNRVRIAGSQGGVGDFGGPVQVQSGAAAQVEGAGIAIIHIGNFNDRRVVRQIRGDGLPCNHGRSCDQYCGG